MDYEIRHGGVVSRGVPQTVRGAMLSVGQKAPDFQVIANDFAAVTLANSAGKVRLISVVPSLDTSVCDTQTRRFNEDAVGLSDKVVVLTISADLPFAQRRWCGASGIDNVVTYSCHRDMKFADDYGVHHLEARLCQRAVFVVDENDTIRYAEYVVTGGQPVDFDAALAALKELV